MVSILPQWKIGLINKLKAEKTHKISFIHTPKCAGTFAESIIRDTNIIYKFHRRAAPGDGLTFTVIRDPVDRFESLLNYRLGEPVPRDDFPERLRKAHFDKKVSLNEIVEKMTDEEIMGFTPYRTLVYWTQDVDLILTIDEFIPALRLFGYKIEKTYPKRNVSVKIRGKLNIKNRERIKRLFYEDCILYNQQCANAKL